jgi:hypothetical protein
VANDPAIETTSLEKSYGRLKVLAWIDPRVEPGSIYSLLGPNGAGLRGHVLPGAKRRWRTRPHNPVLHALIRRWRRRAGAPDA